MSYSKIIIDVDNLAYRGWFAMSFNDPNMKKIAYSMLRDLISLRGALGKGQFVFCADGGSIRKDDYPPYKNNREGTEERETIRRQIAELMEQVLPELGYTNLFCHKGYEADDLMAFMVTHSAADENICLVSNDSDLQQLLQYPDVVIYNPPLKAILTKEWFFEKYQLNPEQWPKIKALMGCKTDNIQGIRGIGLQKALKYLGGHHEGRQAAAAKLIKEQRAIYHRNLLLTTLPYPKLPDPQVHYWEDKVTDESWDTVVKKCNLPAVLLGKCPF